MILYPHTVLLLAGEKRKVLLPDVVWPASAKQQLPGILLTIRAYKVDVAEGVN